eukprot:CAMPEP_0197459620 /NCGR_PEP_ID=MMETSP1175-20131217/51889_1 /TAXON_ID=1003142 /ORGANISM="Triceratium dubium, Strain CCMP147" /LENGTH=112 /DNA_ID=CAMNT_0042994539 /DNA_START=99 /DNA_END=433 /DNA_ORIENTATION=-
MSAGFNVATAVLGQLGESFPLTVTESDVQQELLKTQGLLLNKPEDKLLELETMKEGRKREAMRFLYLLLIYAYTMRGQFAMVSCRMMQLSLQYGVCMESALACASYGVLLCG